MKETKQKQINIRISEKEKDELQKMSENHGYENLSKFIIDAAMNRTNNKTKEMNNVYIASLSTAIDYFIHTDSIGKNENGMNKFWPEDRTFTPGGRGIILSKMLNTFGLNNLNINFTGGFTGEFLYKLIYQQEINQHIIKADHPTKINIYVEDKEGKDVSLEEHTSELSPISKEQFKSFVNTKVVEDDYFVLSGSFHKNDVPFLNELLKEMHERGVKIYINTSSRHVEDLIKDIKPEFMILNLRNFSGKVKTRNEINNKIIDFLRGGVQKIAWMIDESLLYFADENSFYSISSSLTEHLTFTGLEDAFISGFIANQDKTLKESLIWAGAAVKTRADKKAEFTFSDILSHYKDITVEEI